MATAKNTEKSNANPGTALATTAASSIMHSAAQAGKSMIVGGLILAIVLLFSCSILFYFAVAWVDHGWS